MRSAQLFVMAAVVGFASSAVNFTECLNSINNNATIEGKMDNRGRRLDASTPNATAITYDLCIKHCGTGHEPFKWTVFSEQFSSWLLPWLALLSQLPFGANDKLDNLESMLLTLGSPTLAAYSLALTVLNGRWIDQLFSKHRYPNAKKAVRILSNLQQSPLRVDKDDVLLASLIMLPQNDKWWEELVVWLEYYPHTWSISAATSIAWVIIAYIFTIVHYFMQDAQNALDPNGDGVGSVGPLWLWLLPIVVGWLQFSPKCDSIRLHQAVDNANSIAHVANPTSQPIKAETISRKRAIYLARSEDAARLDEHSTPPIYNYARFLPWVQSVIVVADAFGIICERDHHHDPVDPGTKWRDRNSEGGDAITALQVANYSLPRPGSVYHHPRHKWGLDSSALCRMFVASAVALILQWGTTGGAVVIVWFTSAIGLGCQSVSYIIYGFLSSLAWTMLLTSSILTYYSTNAPAHSSQGPVVLVRVTHWLSIFFRRLGKLIAVLNAVWIVVIAFFQFSSFYNRCFCNSNILGFGKDAFVIISLASDELRDIHVAQIGGFFFSAGAAIIFAGLVRLMIITPQ